MMFRSRPQRSVTLRLLDIMLPPTLLHRQLIGSGGHNVNVLAEDGRSVSEPERSKQVFLVCDRVAVSVVRRRSCVACAAYREGKDFLTFMAPQIY